MYRFFLVPIFATLIAGCSYINKEISCEQILSDTYSISSLNNFEKNKVGITEADKLSIVLASYNLGPTNILKVASLIDENIENVSWLKLRQS